MLKMTTSVLALSCLLCACITPSKQVHNTDIPQAFQGKWIENRYPCSEYEQADNYMHITPKQIIRHEFVCDVRHAKRSDNELTLVASLSCSEEEETVDNFVQTFSLQDHTGKMLKTNTGLTYRKCSA